MFQKYIYCDVLMHSDMWYVKYQYRCELYRPINSFYLQPL